MIFLTFSVTFWPNCWQVKDRLRRPYLPPKCHLFFSFLLSTNTFLSFKVSFEGGHHSNFGSKTADKSSDREGERLTWDWPEQRNFLAWMLVMVPFSCSSSTAALKILLISSETFLQALSFFVLAALLNSTWRGRRMEKGQFKQRPPEATVQNIYPGLFSAERSGVI